MTAANALLVAAIAGCVAAATGLIGVTAWTFAPDGRVERALGTVCVAALVVALAAIGIAALGRL